MTLHTHGRLQAVPGPQPELDETVSIIADLLRIKHETQAEAVDLAIKLMDTVLERLPDWHKAAVQLDESIQRAEAARKVLAP